MFCVKNCRRLKEWVYAKKKNNHHKLWLTYDVSLRLLEFYFLITLVQTLNIALYEHHKWKAVVTRRIRLRYMAASSESGTYRLCEQWRFRRACASAQSRQNLRCSLIQAVSQEEPSDRKPDPWPLWMAGHAQLKSVMTECSKTQIRLTRSISWQL